MMVAVGRRWTITLQQREMNRGARRSTEGPSTEAVSSDLNFTLHLFVPLTCRPLP